jgi:hypothetical protein
MSEFAFRFDRRYRALLAIAGVRPDRALVCVERGELDARFGPWRVRTPVANVTCTQVTGPYSPLKAIGTRLSFKDRGLTFGTNTERGLCIEFRDPVPGIEPTGRFRHPGLTVTVEDVEGLRDALRQNENVF